MNIVILDGYAANPNDFSWEPLEAFGSLTVYERTKPEEVIARAKDAEILIINKIDMTDEVIAQLPKLKYIGILATGYNNIDTESAHKHGIVVCNIPSYSTESVVQMTFAHILNITNQVAHYANQDRATGEAADLKWTKNPDFCYWDTPLPEIAGKTLGIIGLGHIGMRVATVALAFGLHVVAYTSKDETNLPNGIKKASSLNLLLSSSDIVSLHCPLANNNIHFFNSENIAKMKQGAILINTARGALVDEGAVAEALACGKLGGYGADVMDQEPPLADNPLLKQPHAYLTPHIAWATKEARRRLLDICFANVEAFIQGKPINKV